MPSCSPVCLFIFLFVYCIVSSFILKHGWQDHVTISLCSLFICLFVSLYFCLYTPNSVMSVNMSVCVYMSVCLSVWLYLSGCPPVCPYVPAFCSARLVWTIGLWLLCMQANGFITTITAPVYSSLLKDKTLNTSNVNHVCVGHKLRQQCYPTEVRIKYITWGHSQVR